MATSIELPCTACKNAAVEISMDVAGLVGGPLRYLLGKLASNSGLTLDFDSPTLGRTPAELSQVLGVRCLVCVDAGIHIPT